MKLSCYVYYRVCADQVDNAHQAAHTLVSMLGERLQIGARLLTKVDEPLLWMEVYEDIGDRDAFLAAMNACSRDTGITRYLAANGPRHVELFQCA